MQVSESEDHGIAALTDSDLTVYSVGISTGGVAEIRMATLNPKRHIIATTIDEAGVAFAKEQINNKGLASQIDARIEDIAEPLPYEDSFFDYIYARLVLHYLSKQKLESALVEIRRVLKPGGKLFIVVRSTNCHDANRKDRTYDPVSHLTSVTHTNPETGKTNTSKRYFHTPESISSYVSGAGFSVEYTKNYEEQLSIDFMRTRQPDHTDDIIELLAHK